MSEIKILAPFEMINSTDRYFLFSNKCFQLHENKIKFIVFVLC